MILMIMIMTITINSNHNDSDHTTTNDVNRNIAIHIYWGPHKPTPPHKSDSNQSNKFKLQ